MSARNNKNSAAAAKKEAKEAKKAQEAQKKAIDDALNKQIKDIYAIPDLLESLAPLKAYNKNDLSLRLEVLPISKLDKTTFTWCFDLLKTNMFDFYEKSWGWSDSGKRAELREDNALYLIAYETVEGKEVPVGYSHFRFDYEQDKGTNVLYLYEIQIEKRVQNKGLGKFFMRILELLAIKHQMPCLMLTVFVCNPEAIAFYKKLNYDIDSTSPSKDIKYLTSEEPYDYEIMSKSFRR